MIQQVNRNLTGKRVKALRERKGISQVQLAKIIGVNNSLISKLESGETNSSIPVIQKIASALGVSIVKLLEDDELDPTGTD